ncbi:MAG: hypothetical protein ABI194_05490, partial [Gemmatimonadaceae bacterium]
MSVELAAARQTGLSGTAERVFEIASRAFIVLMGCAWAFSIATSRATADTVNIVSPATAAV